MLEIYLFTLICSQLSNQLKYFKRGGTEKRGGDAKILKRGASRVRGWVPWWAGTPLQIMFDRLQNVLPLSAVGRGGMIGLSIQPNFQKQRA